MKKNKTRMATALAATLLLSAHVVSAQEATQPNPESGKPGFFRQLGKSLKDAGGQMIGVKPTGAAAGQANNNQPIYAPVSGAGKLPGLFKSDNHQLAQQGRLDWPRVALTFQEWGASLPCWTVEARIWTSPTASTAELFRTCANAALTETDDRATPPNSTRRRSGKAATASPAFGCRPTRPIPGPAGLPAPTRPASRSCSTSAAPACLTRPLMWP